MAQYTADFGADSVGLFPSGWTERDGVGSGSPSWLVQSDASGSGGKVLEFTAASDTRRYVELDASRDGNTGSLDILVRFKTPASGIGAGDEVGLCASYYDNDPEESSEIIWLTLRHDNVLRMQQFYYFAAPGAIIWTEDAEFNWTAGTWYQARLSIDPEATNPSGAVVRAKVWKDTEAEPGWLLEKEWPIVSEERGAGVFTFENSTVTHTWDHLIINTTASQVADETGLTVAAEVRASQVSLEVLINDVAAEVQVSQVTLEVLVGGTGDGTGGDGGGGASDGYLNGASQPYIRAWGFTLDGHDYYVLNLPLETLVYDFHSGQWFNWGSENFRVWAALEGVNWYGNVGRILTQYGNASVTQSLSSVLVGDNSNGSLYFLDPTLPWDSDREGNATYNEFQRYLYGQITQRGWEWAPCDSFQLTGSVGEDNPTSSATVKLEYSDDGGHTFVDAGDVTITVGSYNQRLEWPSLGSYQKPGRLFRITDYGALQRIDAMEVHENGS